MNGQPALRILDALRGKKKERAKLGTLLEARFEGRIPGHTGGGIFGDAIAKLLDAGFIELFDAEGKEISQEIAGVGDEGDWTLKRGYEIASVLKGREDEVQVVLTRRLAEIQSALGISITQLLENQDPTWMRIRPLFGKPSGAPWEDVFVLMPFQQDLLPIYTDHIQKVCKDLKLGCKRADDIFGSSQIIDDVWELIANSKVIIADCTGRNPNVFYELGIAHTLGKRVIILAQSEADIPFDIRHIRYIRYQYTPRGMKAFERTLNQFLVEEMKKDA